MKAFRRPFSIVLVLALLFSAFPIVCPEDASRDTHIDLKDAILNLQNLIHTTENPANFKAILEKTICTFRLLAGLKTIIQNADDSKSKPIPTILDSPFLISLSNLSTEQTDHRLVAEPLFYFRSISLSPETPPPQTV